MKNKYYVSLTISCSALLSHKLMVPSLDRNFYLFSGKESSVILSPSHVSLRNMNCFTLVFLLFPAVFSGKSIIL